MLALVKLIVCPFTPDNAVLLGVSVVLALYVPLKATFNTAGVTLAAVLLPLAWLKL
jgi:hypothetical protein